jgi:methionine aminotransferase
MQPIRSKLPNIGTNIFSRMSALAAEHQAVNLAQGFPNYETDPHLQALCDKYIRKGFNQYAPMSGLPVLNQKIVQKVEKLYHTTYSADTEICITAGATQAIFTAITALVRAGEEVIIIEPAYDCYQPAIELCGAKTVTYALSAEHNWEINWADLAKLINPRTRMLIINSPHNPTGKVWTGADMQALARLLEGTEIILLSDEVYEHLTLDGRKHLSVLGEPSLRERALAVFSFGKTLHATGWKLGYIIGAEHLIREFKKVHQFNVFSVNTPFQHAIAEYLDNEQVYLGIPNFFQQKRDFFAQLLSQTPFRLLPCEGTYFQTVDYSQISQDKDTDFAVWLTQKIGVAGIPISAFYTQNAPENAHLLRFCFAKTEQTLEHAAEKLAHLHR